MELSPINKELIINLLSKADGEDLHEIVKATGKEDWLCKTLVLKASDNDIEYYLSEREYLSSLLTKGALQKSLDENLQLKHRLSCIKGDLQALQLFIRENYLTDVFRQNLCDSLYVSEGWNIISNLEIAADLEDDECMTWKIDYYDTQTK